MKFKTALLISGITLHLPLQAQSLGTHGRASLAEEAGAKSDSPGKFGRLFPTLAPFLPLPDDLRTLADSMKDDATHGGESGVPAIYTYFGQFVDHDLSLDPSPLSITLSNPAGAISLRSPELSLDSLYGQGQTGAPQLYQKGNKSAEFQLGRTSGGAPEDLLRVSSGLAVLGDPRNDENLLVAQLHLLFQKLHNKVAASIGANNSTARSTFELSRETVLWHYQWIIINDFLPQVTDRSILDSTLIRGPRFFKPGTSPFIPVEFSGAAYRFGHTMVRENYHHNDNFPNATLVQLFSFTGNGGGAPVPDNWVIDWRRFAHSHPDTAQFNFARKLDPYLTESLHNLPIPDEKRLAARNLIRGRRLGLPTGQDVARQIGTVPLTAAQIEAAGKDGLVAKALGFSNQSPLWYYVLKEAELSGKGERLGPVGSTILAEVFVGLLLADKDSYLNISPGWQPTLRLADGFPVDSLLKLIRFTSGV